MGHKKRYKVVGKRASRRRGRAWQIKMHEIRLAKKAAAAAQANPQAEPIKEEPMAQDDPYQFVETKHDIDPLDHVDVSMIVPEIKTELEPIPPVQIEPIHEKLDFVCSICGLDYAFDDHLESHIYWVHRPLALEVISSSEIYCIKCRQWYAKESDFDNHWPCFGVISRCPICYIISPTKYHFLVHDLTWLNQKSYQCNLCDINTSMFPLSQINIHMKLNHKKIGIYECTHCQKVFPVSTALTAHVYEEHDGMMYSTDFHNIQSSDISITNNTVEKILDLPLAVNKSMQSNYTRKPDTTPSLTMPVFVPKISINPNIFINNKVTEPPPVVSMTEPSFVNIRMNPTLYGEVEPFEEIPVNQMNIETNKKDYFNQNDNWVAQTPPFEETANINPRTGKFENVKIYWAIDTVSKQVTTRQPDLYSDKLEVKKSKNAVTYKSSKKKSLITQPILTRSDTVDTQHNIDASTTHKSNTLLDSECLVLNTGKTASKIDQPSSSIKNTIASVYIRPNRITNIAKIVPDISIIESDPLAAHPSVSQQSDKSDFHTSNTVSDAFKISIASKLSKTLKKYPSATDILKIKSAKSNTELNDFIPDISDREVTSTNESIPNTNTKIQPGILNNKVSPQMDVSMTENPVSEISRTNDTSNCHSSSTVSEDSEAFKNSIASKFSNAFKKYLSTKKSDQCEIYVPDVSMTDISECPVPSTDDYASSCSDNETHISDDEPDTDESVTEKKPDIDVSATEILISGNVCKFDEPETDESVIEKKFDTSEIIACNAEQSEVEIVNKESQTDKSVAEAFKSICEVPKTTKSVHIIDDSILEQCLAPNNCRAIDLPTFAIDHIPENAQTIDDVWKISYTNEKLVESPAAAPVFIHHKISNERVKKDKNMCSHTQIKKLCKIFICDICDMDFLTAWDRKKHSMLVHRPWTIEFEDGAYCVRCKKWFKDEFIFHGHAPCYIFAVKKRCPICFVEKPTLEHFKLHNVVFYPNESTYWCTLCDVNKTFYRLDEINIHRQVVHEKNGVFECIMCESTFKNIKIVKKHILDVHQKQRMVTGVNLKTTSVPLRLYNCKICSKTFFEKYRFDSHHQVHDGALCYVCGQTFKSRAIMYEHLNIHTKEQIFKCKECDAAFVMRKYLTQHQKIHRPKKNFNCEVCKLSFTQQTSLIYHMAVHTRENIFKCTICRIKFDLQSKLSSHMQIHIADGTNPHVCKSCGKHFSHKCNLIVHMRMHPDYKDDSLKIDIAAKKADSSDSSDEEMSLHDESSDTSEDDEEESNEEESNEEESNEDKENS